MVIDRHVEVLAGGPDRVVVRGDKRWESRVGRHARQQDPAEEVMFTRPGDLRHGVVDVVEEDLRHAGTTSRRFRTEVGQPAVVRPEAGPAQLVALRGRWPRQQIARGKEGRNGVGEQDLRHDAIVLELALTCRRVPIAICRLAPKILVRIHIGLCPDIELVEISTLEVVPIVQHLRAGVAVGRNHDVAVVGEWLHLVPPQRVYDSVIVQTQIICNHWFAVTACGVGSVGYDGLVPTCESPSNKGRSR